MALELFRLSDSRWNLELELPARVRQVGYLLELDDLAGSDIAIETLERLAADSHDPRAQAYVPLERSRRRALEGFFDEAERLTAEAGRLGARLRDSTIPIQTAAQVVGIRWAQGRIREMRANLKGFADAYAAMPVFRAAFALASCEDGREADARRELRLLSANDFEGIPRDNVWLLAMALLSETAAHLQDAEAAEVLYRLFAPFDGRNVTSPDAIFAGPVARYLGLLAAARGERESADATSSPPGSRRISTARVRRWCGPGSITLACCSTPAARRSARGRASSSTRRRPGRRSSVWTPCSSGQRPRARGRARGRRAPASRSKLAFSGRATCGGSTSTAARSICATARGCATSPSCWRRRGSRSRPATSRPRGPHKQQQHRRGPRGRPRGPGRAGRAARGPRYDRQAGVPAPARGAA